MCRSGTEEDYSEMTQLLKDIASYQRNILSVKYGEGSEEKEGNEVQSLSNNPVSVDKPYKYQA